MLGLIIDGKKSHRERKDMLRSRFLSDRDERRKTAQREQRKRDDQRVKEDSGIMSMATSPPVSVNIISGKSTSFLTASVNRNQLNQKN